MNQRVKIEVRGIVQGVGFRPYIYRLAQRFHLTGTILNSESGVSIEVQGTTDDVNTFLRTLPAETPPLAQLHEISTSPMNLKQESSFLILQSTRSSTANTFISPDIATCKDCTSELLDPTDRRHRYPFTNCTNCGPRFTIVRSVPYDRAQTSMAGFRMCTACQAEYDDPLNRRFHAQPNACWDCGPQLQLVDRAGTPQPGDPLAQAIRLLQQGSILAIKGLGGFHLAVDAHQPNAVQELRRRKARGKKPFAIMVRDTSAAAKLCTLTPQDAALLESIQRPIVLIPRRTAAFNHLAPDGNHLGLFLPYTPLHHLLFANTRLDALVMTSANLSEEPIAIDNTEALTRLATIADFFLLHNRDILLRCDDSVVQNLHGRTQFIRRSRGFVPAPIQLKDSVPSILAVGGELKNTVCVSRGRYAFLGQHIGDLENLSAYDFFQESIHHLQQILEVQPTLIAHDLHPGYLSTQWARSQTDAPTIAVQHHHAHIASCMAENHLTGKVIGIALDGTGYGTDGTAWGSEILIADLHDFERAAHLAYTPMPGNAQAIHEPWRMAVAHLWQTFGHDWRDHLPPSLLANIPTQSLNLVEQMLHTKTNSPLTSSCGRLFDAVAALVLGRLTVSYEAQAAIALEACCDPRTDLGAYTFALSNATGLQDDACLQIDARPLFAAILEDLHHDVAPGILSRRFHNGLADILTEATLRIVQRTGLDRVCLSGGVFLNAILSNSLDARLTSAGCNVFTHSQVPPGDGGLSLGQLAIAANRR